MTPPRDPGPAAQPSRRGVARAVRTARPRDGVELPSGRSRGTTWCSRREGAPAQGREALHARPDDLLQLRVGLRAARVRRQGRPVDQEARGQPGPPRLPRPQLRQGPGDDQPGQRPGADPVPAAARRASAAAASSSGSRWDEALDDIAGRIRAAIVEDRRDEVMYHVGRPGEDGFAERVLLAWGVDGHNSHTNICSAGARLGYTLWGGYDRPSPDYANAKVILLISSHLETGHYFNPHAQRIMEGKSRRRREARRARPAAVQHRLARRPVDGALAGQRGRHPAGHRVVPAARPTRCDRDFVERWVNWDATCEQLHPEAPTRRLRGLHGRR